LEWILSALKKNPSMDEILRLSDYSSTMRNQTIYNECNQLLKEQRTMSIQWLRDNLEGSAKLIFSQLIVDDDEKQERKRKRKRNREKESNVQRFVEAYRELKSHGEKSLHTWFNYLKLSEAQRMIKGLKSIWFKLSKKDKLYTTECMVKMGKNPYMFKAIQEYLEPCDVLE